MIYAHILPRNKAEKLKHLKGSHSEYIEALRSIDSSIEPLENYIGDKKKIYHICKNCSFIWKVLPSNGRKGRGCPECKRKKLSSKKTLSEKEYKDRLKEQNPDYSLVGSYINQRTKTAHKCLKCGYVWDVTPSNLLSQVVNCPSCRKKIMCQKLTLSQDEFYSRFKKYGHPNIIQIGKYVSMNDKIFYQCVNGHSGEMSPETLLRGCNCKKCSDVIVGQKRLLSNDEFVSRVHKKHPNIKILSEYNGAKKPILFQIGEEKTVRKTSAWALLVDSRWDHSFKGEVRIEEVLHKYHIKFEKGKRYSDLRGKRNPLSYDFYLPNFNLLIEFQGEQHCRSVDLYGGKEALKKQQKHDNLKRKYAYEHDIKLLEIWYYEYDYIEEILFSFLKLGTVETAG